MNKNWWMILAGTVAAGVAGYGTSRYLKGRSKKKAVEQQAEIAEAAESKQIEKNSCPSCGKPVKEYEFFCPYCGYEPDKTGSEAKQGIPGS